MNNIRRRHTNQGGNAVLEGALALPPLFMILFATIDFSMALLMRNTAQAAVREGVRYAVTGQTMSGMGQDASIRQVIENNSLGFITSSNAASLVTINYYNPSTLVLQTGTGSNAAGNIVQVQISGLSWAWMVPYGRGATPLQFTVTSADIVEANSTGIPPTR